MVGGGARPKVRHNMVEQGSVEERARNELNGEMEEEQQERRGGIKQNNAGCDVEVWRRGEEGEEAPSLAPPGVIGSWTANLSQLNQQRLR